MDEFAQTENRLLPLGEVQIHLYSPMGSFSTDSHHYEDDIDPAILPRLKKIRNLGNESWTRFKQLGRESDANTAVSCRTRVYKLLPEGHPARPAELSGLGNLLRGRFEHFGDLEDLEKAIEYQTTAISLVDETHIDRPVFLNSLGVSLARRFASLGDLADIEKAISHLQQALSLIQEGHVETPSILNNLGLFFRRRYARLGTLSDIHQAIEHQQKAIAVTPKDNIELPSMLDSLGNSFGRRFEGLGDLRDLEKAIEYQEQGLLLTTNVHAERPRFINNLGSLFWRRYDRLGDLDDLETAINYYRQALSLAPDNYSETYKFLNNLGTALIRRFERFGNLEDIIQIISFQKKAEAFQPKTYTEQHGLLNNMGTAFQLRFERLGALSDIDEAIKLQNSAIMLIPEDHPRKPRYLVNLSIAFISRFDRLQDSSDLESAVKHSENAVSILSDDNPEKSRALQCMGLAFQRRFTSSSNLADINSSIECQKLAASSLSKDHSERPGILHGWGCSLVSRFTSLNHLPDIELAIDLYQEAVSLTPQGHQNIARFISNLATSFRLKFGLSNDLADIDKSIELHQKAILLTPNSHPTISQRLVALGCAFESRFQYLDDMTSVGQAIGAFQKASQATQCSASQRFEAARHWIRLSAEYQGTPALEAYRLAMDLIPYIIWLGRTVDRRYLDAEYIGDFVVEAAAASIGSENYVQGLEWLEEGRSFVWQQLLQLRQPLEELRAVDADLANCIKDVGTKLEAAGTTDDLVPSLLGSTMTVEQISQDHRRLAEEWDQLVSLARLIPGFEKFLQPKRLSDLAPAARHGPVVVINVHKTRCDALALVTPARTVIHIPLPSFSYNKAATAQKQWEDSLSRYGVRDRGRFVRTSASRPRRETFQAILASLWLDVVKPIIDGLGVLRIHPGDLLARVTWCSTGPLAFLPIHAAGLYNKESSGLRVFDHVISSYTPTISALLARANPPVNFHGVFAVAQENTPGLSQLPFALEELSRIQKAIGKIPLDQLHGIDATVDQTLGGFKKHSWVHLACHAVQDRSNPNKSGFFLQDGLLNLNEIAKSRLDHPQLAFLSACQTAVGHRELPDEAIHLAAGMIMAGFPTVVATMWSIKDKHAPLISEQFYSNLQENGLLDASRAAFALHNAVAVLRQEIGEDKYEEWAPFIHIGI